MTTRESWAAGLPRLSRPLVMGVVNVTPDSFSDGGRFVSTDAAIAHAVALRDQGADVLDIGGESTRPGATRPLVAEELDRVIPVIRSLASDGVAVSVDTMRHEVARAALESGAVLVNDVSGGLADPRILQEVADSGAAYVAMHWRAHSTVMQQHASYDDVLGEVRDELAQRLDDAVAAGIPVDRIVVDPGLGFAKTADHNWQLLQRLPELNALGAPVLVGSSRKSFLGSLARGARRHTESGARPRGRQRRADHDRGHPGGLGGTGPRGPREHGRPQGGCPLGRCSRRSAGGRGLGAGRAFRSPGDAGSVRPP